jgi:hypothetical protein
MMSTCTARPEGRRSSTITQSILAAFLGFSLTSAAASAQSYPSKPVQVVVPFAAGGGVDTATRVVADVAGEILGQRFASTIGAAAARSSAPRPWPGRRPTATRSLQHPPRW